MVCFVARYDRLSSVDIYISNHVIDIKPDGAPSHQFTIKVVGLSGNSDINEMFEL